MEGTGGTLEGAQKMLSAGCVVGVVMGCVNSDKARAAQERSQNRADLRQRMDVMKADFANTRTVKQMQARLASQVASQLVSAEYEKNKAARAQATLGRPVSL